MVKSYIVRPHYASFNYPHNWVKVRVLALLAYFTPAFGNRASLPISVIVKATNGNYASIASLLCRWSDWRYVVRYREFKSWQYRYRIGSRGYKFLAHVPQGIIEYVCQEIKNNLIDTKKIV